MERLKPGYPMNGTMERGPKSPYGLPPASPGDGHSQSLDRTKKRGYMPPHSPGENTFYAYRVEHGPSDFDKRVVEGKVRKKLTIYINVADLLYYTTFGLFG